MFEHTIQKEWTVKETIAKYDFINLRNCVHYKKKNYRECEKTSHKLEIISTESRQQLPLGNGSEKAEECMCQILHLKGQ